MTGRHLMVDDVWDLVNALKLPRIDTPSLQATGTDGRGGAHYRAINPEYAARSREQNKIHMREYRLRMREYRARQREAALGRPRG